MTIDVFRNFFQSGYLYVAGTIILTVLSQLIIKWRVADVDFSSGDFIYDKIIFFIKFLFDPFILLAISSIFFSGIFWILSLTKFELSSIYPMIATSLMIVTSVSSILIFNENVNVYKICGVIISLFGVYVISIGASN